MLPSPLVPLLTKRDFWRRFFWDVEDGREYPELEDCRIAFPLGNEASLVLEVDEILGYFSLELEHPSLPEPVELGWDDQAHWHPHVLRWEELDLLGRWVSLLHPELQHPGPVVVLLHRFTPLCRGDDAAVVYPLLETAYQSLGVFRGKVALEDRCQRYDFRDAGFVWGRHPEYGWTLEQDESAPDAAEVELYTLRRPAEGAFPFALWNGLMAQVREQYRQSADPAWLEHAGGSAGELARAMAASGDLARRAELADALEQAGCDNRAILEGLRGEAAPVTSLWILELLLSEEPGALVRKQGGPERRQPRVIHRFEIRLPGYPVRPLERPDRLMLQISGELNRLLKQNLSGGAEPAGMDSTYTPNGRKLLKQTMIIGCRAVDDADEAIRIVRTVLREHGAPPGTTLRQKTREEREIPLSQEDES